MRMYSSTWVRTQVYENVLKYMSTYSRIWVRTWVLELKTKIAKYAVENGIKAAVKKFKDPVPNAPDNWKNTVRDWKDSYLRELERKRKAGDMEDITCLPAKKRGRPLMIWSELDRQVQDYIMELRKAHATVNTAIVVSAGKGIVQWFDASPLSSNGGTIQLTKDWAKSFLVIGILLQHPHIGPMKRQWQRVLTKSLFHMWSWNERNCSFLPLFLH